MKRLHLRSLLLASIVLPLTGCFAATPLTTAPTNNSSMDVDEMLTHDGCTVYRFRDIAYHYYVRCRDDAQAPTRGASTSSIVSCGKNCTRVEDIQTVSR